MHPRRSLLLASSLVLLGLALPATPARAADLALDLRFSMAGGGESLADVTYSDGSTDSLTLGTCFAMKAGPVLTAYRSGPHALELSALVGYCGWSTGPENTDDRISLSRFPIDVLAFYRLTPGSLPVGLRLGGGLTYQLIGGATGSGSLDGLDVDIDNALGWVGEVGVTYDLFYFGLRYTGITYRVAPGVDMDASSIGGMVGAVLPL